MIPAFERGSRRLAGDYVKTIVSLIAIVFCLKAGAQNRAAHFPTYGSYYTCGNVPISGHRFTVEALVRRSAPYVAPGQVTNVLNMGGGHPVSNANFFLGTSGCYIKTTTGSYGTLQEDLTIDTFYHVAVTYDGSALKYYINGCLYRQTSASGDILPSATPLIIGQLPLESPDQPIRFTGDVDEVRIWSMVRTEQEIRNFIHNFPNPNTQPDLLAYYKFEGDARNVQGSNIYDGLAQGNASIAEEDSFSRARQLEIEIAILQQPSCNGNNGKVRLTQIGGYNPWAQGTFSVDGGPWTPIPTFDNLGPGTHTASVRTVLTDCVMSTSFNLSSTCATNATAAFTTPDTVCVNTPVTITNNSTGATTYNWSFCTANANNIPTGINLGNPGNQLTTPCFIDYAFYNGNWYGFIVSNNPPSLVRLDFGNSLLNTPTAVNLGNFNNDLPLGAQGIQLVEEGGRWLAIIVGGDVNAAPWATSRILKVDFGASLTNTSPVMTNWGNVGSMAYPHDLYVFKDAGTWYGFTVNYQDNSITRFNFGTDFSTTPTGTNLGNPGNLNRPSGICPVNDNGIWRIFVANFGNNTVSRIDFANSLLNPPSNAVNLGNLGATLNAPRDFYIFNYCNESIGFLVNDATHNMVRLNFSSLSATPTAASIGNVAGFSNPHSLSKLFRVGSDLFSFVPNSYVNTVSRVQFQGCTNSSAPNSSLQSPPPVTYSAAGTYNINLTIDEGLLTQTSFCKKVVVLAKPIVNASADVNICPGGSTAISATISGASSFSWSPAAGLSDPNSANPIASPATTTEYILTATNAAGCVTKDTVTVTVLTPQQCGQAAVVPNFSTPDTVCVNQPVNIINNTVGASSYYWNFCTANVSTPPAGVNFGNIAGKFSAPVYVDYVYEGGNYYGFMTNNWPGSLLRLNFGNSLLNTPTVTDLGTVGGIVPGNTEGVQVVKNAGKWYLIIVGGDPAGGNASRVVKIELGTDIANNSPTGTNWGNIGNLSYPHDLYVFDDNGHWYGLTVNTTNNTITRFDFTTSFSNTPTGTNLGNLGDMNGPTGLHAFKENNNWYAFVTNAFGNSLTRLDFGTSLLNTPSATNLGNVGGLFSTPWDIYVMKYCGQSLAFLINAGGNDLVKLDFNGSLTNLPTASTYGNIGNLSFPHCLSKIFRAGADLYTLIPNVNNNTLSRIRFTGCASSSIPNSTAQNPPPVVYNTPGTYNINLTIDDGLPTQDATCRQVVVRAIPTNTPLPDTAICPGDAVTLNSNIAGAGNIKWTPAAGLSSTTVANPVATPSVTTQYIVTADNGGGCLIRDTVTVTVKTAQQCALSVVIPGFTAPDTVCVNTPVNITNTTTGASSYFWNFCVANLAQSTPTASNLGNPGNRLASPVFMDYAYYNGNYYGFAINHNPGQLIRLDFGNSLLNTPTSVSMGNFGGIIPPGQGAEGIQVVFNEGRWYAIIVGGYVPTGSTPRILKIDFGADLSNPTPTATNWGNIGGMSQPIDLHVFKENNQWYGLTVNAENNSITRFSFTNSFNNVPTAVNLGNIGGLSYPTGIYAISDNGVWRVFITNGGSAARVGGNYSLTRLDFGNSLLNTPTGVNLGNPGNLLQHPRDLTIVKLCDQIVGFAVNGHPNNSNTIRLNFGTDLSQVPTATTLGDLGSPNFPHSISRLFRVNGDVYGFITNVANNTITRLKFDGCNNASIPNSAAQDPPPVIYNTPGIYNINLTVDDGLPTQGSFCKQVVVMPPPAHAPTKNLTFCEGTSLKIGAAIKPANYLWNTGATTDSIQVSAPGTYWVEYSRFGCSSRDSFVVSYKAKRPVDFVFNQNFCDPSLVSFIYNPEEPVVGRWDLGDGNTSQLLVFTHQFAAQGTYTVKLAVQFPDGCRDSIAHDIAAIAPHDETVLFNSHDTTICLGDSLQLTKAFNDNFCWSSTSSVLPSSSGWVKPVATTTYRISAKIKGPNLVQNGDFSAGNTGFISDHISASPNSLEGQYWVGTSPASWNPGLSACRDHTSGSGNMLMVNAATTKGKLIWSQTVGVTPNTNYEFSAWMQSLVAQNPGRVAFKINGVTAGAVWDLSSITCTWNSYPWTWNSGNASSAVLSLVSMNDAASGNDFAIDDIYFGPVVIKQDSIRVNVTGLCDSVKLIGPDKICSPSDTLTYTIYRAANCTQAYNLTVDNAFAEIVSQTPNSIRVVFKQNGTTRFRVSYANNCKIVKDSLDITVKFSPTVINFGPDITGCRDTALTLHAGPGFDTYLWQNGTSDSLFQVNVPGVYHVIAKNICGLSLTDTLRLVRTVPAPFGATPAAATVCVGDSIQFKATGGSVYAWQPAANFARPDQSVSRALADITQNYTVHISDPVCQRDTMVVIPVTVQSQAQIDLVKSNDVNCGNDSAILVASGGVSYNWSPSLGIVRRNGAQITVKPGQTTTYYVTGVNATGCFGKDSVTVEFVKAGEQRLFMPNAFTPNGDGLNDVLRPVFIGPALKYEFRVYNRWGQLVFKTNKPSFGWDGKVNSKLQGNEVFIYIVTAEGGCNGHFEQKGSFVLIK